VKAWTSIAIVASLTALGVAAGLMTASADASSAEIPSTSTSEAPAITTASAIPGIVAAMTAEDEVDDHGASQLPRPDGSKRLYFQPLDDVQLVSVYVANDAPADVSRTYARALGAAGFVVHEDLPRPASGITFQAKKAGRASVLVTVTAGETGTLLTLVETKPEAAR
jgi:hypothetical protein